MAGAKRPGSLGAQDNPAKASMGSPAGSQPSSGASTSRVSLSHAAEDAISAASLAGTKLTGAIVSVESAATAVAAKLKVQEKDLHKDVRDTLSGAYCIYLAGVQSIQYVPNAILEETGYQLEVLIHGFLPGFLQALAIVGATTVLCSGIGWAVGLFAGGVGAIPGAVIGAELGFDVGSAVLSWVGLAFLAKSIGAGFGELVTSIHNGIDWAWQAKDSNNDPSAQKEQVDKAARQIGKAAGIFMRLILQGIVVEILRRPAVAFTQRTITVAGRIGTKGVAAAADASAADFIAGLRASKLGPAFAEFVEKHWEELKKNPKLQPKGAGIGGTAAAEGGGGSSAETPQLSKQQTSTAVEDEPAASEPEKPAAKAADKQTATPPPAQSGQIGYGSSDLSQKAIAYRQAEGVTGGRNVAVFEYRASDGTLQTVEAASERGVGHAERIAAEKLSERGVQPSQVTRIYSELQPCNMPGGYCAAFISRTFPQADVTWSFEYGTSAESRAAGVAALKAAQEASH